MIGAISNAISGLFAASKRAEASASNIANMTTTGSMEEGGKKPYSAQVTVQEQVTGGGVRAENIPLRPGFSPTYAPDSPFANEEGIIGVPDVDLAAEAANLSMAKAAYKANAKLIKVAGEMQDELLSAFDRKV